MDTPQPQPEVLPSPEETEEKLNVYELTPTKTEADQILEKINPTETKAASSPAPEAPGQAVPADAAKEEGLLEKIETTLKIKKPAPKPVVVEDEKPKKPDSFWVEQVQKVIKMFGRKPHEEQKKAQALEEDYLEEHEIKVNDNGEK